MKKIFLFILSSVLLIGLLACSNQGEDKVVTNEEQGMEKQINEETSKKDVREVVWEQLSSEQKERINGTWKDGKVSKTTLNESMMSEVEDKSYAGKEVYLIDFPTKSKSIPNNMIVYADVNTFDCIGIGLVD